jgi:glycosyltransferase involved in cell wall biosynthesis
VTRADSVVCVTAQHADLLRRRYPRLPAGKFVTIPNGYDESEWEGVRDGGAYQAATFVITYAGWLYEERTPEPLFRALRSLIDRGDVDISRLQIDLIGWCETAQGQSVKALAARWGLDQCLRIEGPFTKNETFRRLTGSSLLLLLAEGWTLRVPAKAYEYLRAGRPVLALTPTEGAIADLFRRTGGGWVVEHTDDSGITAAVREAYRSWSGGQPARTPDPRVVGEFDRARLASRLAAILDSNDIAMERRP